MADNNVMPSMVVRQQRIQMSNGANPRCQSLSTNDDQHLSSSGGQARMRSSVERAHNSSIIHQIPQPPPPPPPHTEGLIKAAKEMANKSTGQQDQIFDQNGLVIPKRVLHHPLSMAQPLIRDLNREIKFNQARGKNVLDQKSELKRALEKREDNRRKKEVEQERLSRRTSLELRLEERAERIAKGMSSLASPRSVGATSLPASSSASSAPTQQVGLRISATNEHPAPPAARSTNPIGNPGIQSTLR